MLGCVPIFFFEVVDIGNFLKPLKIWCHLRQLLFSLFHGEKNLKTPEICQNDPYLWPRWSGPFFKKKTSLFEYLLRFLFFFLNVPSKVRTSVKLLFFVKGKKMSIAKVMTPLLKKKRSIFFSKLLSISKEKLLELSEQGGGGETIKFPFQFSKWGDGN